MLPRSDETGLVQASIEQSSGGVGRERRGPRRPEPLMVAVAALAARPVAGGQRGGFVEEVQLGEPIGPPLGAVPAVEFEPTDDPVTALAVTDGFAVDVQ